MVNRQFGGFSRQVHLESQVRTFVSTKPTMKKTRFVGTALSLFLGLAAFYFSLFYLPAYVNQSSIARVTSHERVSPSLDVLGTPVQWYSPYIDLLRLRCRDGAQARKDFPYFARRRVLPSFGKRNKARWTTRGLFNCLAASLDR